ncbi:MAG TPA: hypothetical protein VEY09_06125 [Pyrinomonadaceae bacterium]|nr:hypothetical protein [Pyrinomonadaceae bacterium]
MIETTNIRLPGVYFLPRRAGRGGGLPTLDVAGFVGFAERGPLDLPVAVEDPDTFAAVFGGDLPLARERGGHTVSANLRTSVVSFFANGGRRCYVVRVAGENAKRARFRLPGLVAFDAHGSPRLVSVSASSEGRWSAALKVGARLSITPLWARPQAPGADAAEVFKPERAGSNLRLRWLAGGAPHAIRPGDLLRLTFDDESRALFAVGSIERAAAGAGSSSPQPLILSGVVRRLAGPKRFKARAAVKGITRLTFTGEEPLSASGELAAAGEGLRLELEGADAGLVRRGDVLRLRLDEGDYLFAVGGLGAKAAGAGPEPAVALGGRSLVAVAAAEGAAIPEAPRLRAVERLRFDLSVWQGRERRPPSPELSFNDGGPRFWGDVLLAETSLLRRRPTPTPGDRPQHAEGTSSAARNAELYRLFRRGVRVTDPRLGEFDATALAGLLAPTEESGLTYLPLDMPALPGEAEAEKVGPAEAGDDGLDTFDASVFLDPSLARYSDAGSVAGDALLREAFDIYYVQNRRLRGLHSLLFSGEVALLSVSDATHRAWGLRPASEAATPEPAPPEAPPDFSYFDDCRLGSRLGVREAEEDSAGAGAGGSSPRAGGGSSPDSGGGPARNAGGAGAVEEGRPLPVSEPVPEGDDELAPLLRVQHAVLNFCQARGDVLGVLTLPAHFGRQRCVRWLEEFRAHLGLPRRPSFTGAARDAADLSFVSVYHPWLLLADDAGGGRVRAASPDGAACGTVAARERERQVWVAPANVPLRGVLGLTPAVTRDEWAELFDLQFNLAREGPRDFRVMSAHTLSEERIWLQISVRRLLILVRKLVVERGMDFVFESNHERFREGMRMVLSDALRGMFERGAFAGASPSEAFVVRTDSSVNTARDVEAGRFVAQIQVAPSQPLEFITVLLTRVGEDMLQAAEG